MSNIKQAQEHKDEVESYVNYLCSTKWHDNNKEEVVNNIVGLIGKIIEQTIKEERERIVREIENLIKIKTIGVPFPTVEQGVAEEIINLIKK